MILNYEDGSVTWLHDHKTNSQHSVPHQDMPNQADKTVMAGNTTTILCDALSLQETEGLQASSESELTQQQVCRNTAVVLYMVTVVCVAFILGANACQISHGIDH